MPRYLDLLYNRESSITYNTYNVGACGLVDKALDSRSEGLGFDSQCWPCVAVLGKLCIPHCLGPPSRNGYLVHRSKVGSIVAGCIGAHLARRKVKSVEHALSWSLDSKQLPLHFYLYNIHGMVKLFLFESILDRRTPAGVMR